MSAGLAPRAGAASPTRPPSYSFFAGAGQSDTTPPAAGTVAGSQADAAFAPGFGTCPATASPSRGRFALQEPFADLNGDGQWDGGFDLTNGPTGKKPDPFCDTNANGRWDGIYADNGNGPASGVHDPLAVRAIAISDGHNIPVVYASVDVIGLFDYYTEQARSRLLNTYGVHADLVVSADHNESSPDTVGLYGSPQTPLSVGIRSGINEYYMAFLEDRIARAAAAAVHDLRPADLYANQVQGRIPDGAAGSSYPLLTGMSQRISDQFPTSVALPGDDRVAAVDPKLGVLQARTPAGQPVFTVMSLAAHNQEMGNSGAGLSSDWPGAFEHAFEQSNGGTAMFLAGDNGSEEDPSTSPAAIPSGSENHSNQVTQFIQAQATGRHFAEIVASAASSAVRLNPGPVTLTRQQFCVPLENNGFVALAASGDFGLKQGYACGPDGRPLSPVPNGGPAPTGSTQFRTFVSYADIGPDLQMLDNPGEAFPALMLGSPFGVQDASCSRPNPSVPTWRARALFRFQVGLADDLIGYLIPAWGFASGTPGLFNNDTCYQDANHHRHKLESESAGPTSANDVANRLSALLAREPDPSARIRPGRFVSMNGAYSRWPTGAAGVLVAAPGATALAPAHDLLIGAPGVSRFGGRRVDLHGLFMDYDGQPQAAPDITTRGMLVLGADGCVAQRFYLDVFGSLSAAETLGGAVPGQPSSPVQACGALSQNGVPELQPGAAGAARLPVAGTASCPQTRGPLGGLALGPVRLTMTRAGVHRTFARNATRRRRYLEFFCLVPSGIRVGYASPKLLRPLSPSRRRRLTGRVVEILTANRHFALRGVRVRMRIGPAARRLKLGRPYHVGLNYWYLVPNGASRGVLKVRHGRVQEIGIADRRLTQTRGASRIFLRSFN